MDRESFTNNRLIDDVRADSTATATEILLAERLAEAVEELERMEHAARRQQAQQHAAELPENYEVG
jgi:hypothetical protein